MVTPWSSGPRVSMVPVPLGSVHWENESCVQSTASNSPWTHSRITEGTLEVGVGLFLGGTWYFFIYHPASSRQLTSGDGRCSLRVITDYPAPKSPFTLHSPPCHFRHVALHLLSLLAENPSHVAWDWSPLFVIAFQYFRRVEMGSRCPEVES